MKQMILLVEVLFLRHLNRYSWEFILSIGLFSCHYSFGFSLSFTEIAIVKSSQVARCLCTQKHFVCAGPH